jgi:DNA-binding transcriptional MocR family regulator
MRGVIFEIESRLDEASSKGLAAAVARAIREGVLGPGDRLPPIRDLSRELALSPTTVSTAWGLLTRAGTIRTAGRRGTLVADLSAPRDGRYRRAVGQPTRFALDLSTGVPDAALLPGLGRALEAVTTAGTPRSYLDAPVLPELEEVLRSRWPYAPPELAVVDGALDALDIVIRTTVRYGDRVIVEHPTFPPLLDLLEAAGAQVVGVPLDTEGLALAPLTAALQAPTCGIFLQPRAHNPTGISMTAERVAAVAQVVRVSGTGALVVEDDSAGDISTSPDISVGTFLPEETLHIRSYSKSHGPDLRLAAMSGPLDTMAAIRHHRELGQGWSSRLLQRVLLSLLTDAGSIAEVAAARDEYARRRREFVRELVTAGIPVTVGDGLNVWVPVRDETAALMRLAAHGIGVAPGTPFTVLPEEDRHVRITCGLLGDDLLAVAHEVIAAVESVSWGSRAR